MSNDEQSPVTAMLGPCVVTGGAGFLGQYLVKGLLDAGHEVRALVRNTPLQLEHPRLTIVKGSIEDDKGMVELCQGAGTVFHTAAQLALMGGSAVTESYRCSAYQANVVGTQNMIAACRSAVVARLVHTSSIDVCFDGEDNTNMDEHTPYSKRMTSVYTETKIEAEKAVLAADDPNGLRTVALRPAGIYGAASNVMLDEIFKQVLSGNFVATVGFPGGVQDHIFVENLVHAHHLVAQRLAQTGVPGGKAYFVSDGHRQPIFEFFRPFIEGIGFKMPRFSVPVAPLLAAMRLQQFLHFKLGAPAPTLAPHELLKVKTSHCGNNDDAERDFGYRPIYSSQEAMALSLLYYKERLKAL